ncbi:HPr-rel-A system PqqD family peptide chaperone [Sedimenticola sp.]|uniref:HPr-rel-A system PqqD family peptide chaperone n=1 Tax=Sedimenticola sp. TaxID=1940285 RepID=UPI003D126675
MEAATTTERLWFANAPDQFCWGVWPDEEEAVLFHQGSGDTLMLNPLGEFLLKRLQIEQQTQSELAASAATYFDISNDNELAGAVYLSLLTFRSLGLVISDSL